MHHVILPLTNVNSAVAPRVYALALNRVILPLSHVVVAIGPDVDSPAFLLGVNIVSSEFTLVSPSLVALSMLLVIPPLA
jgi:hypothetical protein